MSDEPRFRPRRVYISDPVSLPPRDQIRPAGGVYFSAAAGGHVCLIPETELTPQAVVGDLPPVIDRLVLARLQRHNLEHLEHRMILTAARPLPADAAFLHREGRQAVAAYEIRTWDRQRFRAWSVFFFVDVRRSRRRVVHSIIRPCTPGGGLEVDCKASRPFRAANESWLEHDRDIKQAWGMLISYQEVACEAAQPTVGREAPPPAASVDDSLPGERLTGVQQNDANLLRCTRLGAPTSVTPSLHLELAGTLDFVTVLSVVDMGLGVELPRQGLHQYCPSQTKASHLLRYLSHESLILQALTQLRAWRHYRAESCALYLAELLRGAEAFRPMELRAAILRNHMIGVTEGIWQAKASYFPDGLHQVWSSPVRALCLEDIGLETTVQ